MRGHADADAVVVYWRPGCGFCWRLLRRLDRAGIAHTRVDIWENPEAAAFVRSVAGGNETVPTVTVGASAMVNPSLAAIEAAVGLGAAAHGRDRRS